MNSHSDSESREHFSDFDDLFDKDISESEHRIAERKIFRDIYWFCRLLMLWQCINYVSDIAVGLLLKLISSFLLIISFSSERCREFYNIFPNHRLPHFRRPCGKALLYEVHSISSNKILYPFKTFCYKSVRSSLENLV